MSLRNQIVPVISTFGLLILILTALIATIFGAVSLMLWYYTGNSPIDPVIALVLHLVGDGVLVLSHIILKRQQREVKLQAKEEL